MTATTVETIGDTQIRIQRAFDAPVDLVFAAHTQPDHLVAWMTGPQDMALVEATMDVRAGGAFVWVYRGPNGDEMTMRGSFSEVDAPHRMVQRDDWGPDIPSPEIETTFEEVAGQTVVTVTYTLPDRATGVHMVVDGGMTDAYRQSHERLTAVLAGS
jgi:uncharacterized protein YndB with AHSA1/START domain